jgi:type II restriction enzyme
LTQSESLIQRIEQHKIKNIESKRCENNIIESKNIIMEQLIQEYPNEDISWQQTMHNKNIIKYLSVINPDMPDYTFQQNHPKSYVRPDGGFLFWNNNIVICAEVKKQGTNKKRMEEGKKKQALGNAIERLGKNLSLCRTIFRQDIILPFVCFGHGCDFSPQETILDRGSSMNEFHPLNKIFVYNNPPYEPCSIFLREKEWGIEEMTSIMYEIVQISTDYYKKNNMKDKHILLRG